VSQRLLLRAPKSMGSRMGYPHTEEQWDEPELHLATWLVACNAVKRQALYSMVHPVS
jgi:hypothetical protein